MILLNFWVTLQRLYDLLWVVLLDYTRSLPFFFADLRLALFYVGKGPYAVSKEYLAGQGASDVYTYGETPICVMRKVAKLANITADDVVYELGCGTGRTCAWLHHRIGCKVVGVERIPTFVRRAPRGPTIVEGDFHKMDLREATVIYCYTFDDVPSGVSARIVSLEPSDGPSIEVRFPWGKTRLYLS